MTETVEIEIKDLNLEEKMFKACCTRFNEKKSKVIAQNFHNSGLSLIASEGVEIEINYDLEVYAVNGTKIEGVGSFVPPVKLCWADKEIFKMYIPTNDRYAPLETITIKYS